MPSIAIPNITSPHTADTPTIIDSKSFPSGAILNQFTAILESPYTATPPPNYAFEFSDIDGKISNAQTVYPGAATATFWYAPDSINGPPTVYIWGFDATQDVMAGIEFTVTPQGGRAEVVASGFGIATSAGGATVQPPLNDGVPQEVGYGAGAFQNWYDIGTGLIVASQGNTLTVGQNQSDSFLAVYASQSLQTPPNCPALLGNLAAAEYAVAHNTNPALTNRLAQLYDEALAAAEPCLGKSAGSPPKIG